MTRLLPAVGWLVAVWVALSGSASPTSLLAGGAAAVALLVLFRPAHRETARASLRPRHLLSFLLFFIQRFAMATVQVALAVLAPGRARRRGLIAVPIAAPTELTTTLLATAVSLTPGTCFIEMHHDPKVMYVHVLQLRSVSVQRLEILDMERRIVRAFGPPAAVQEVEAIMARVSAEGGE